MITEQTETINCECGTSYHWTPEDAESTWKNIYRPIHCPECSERINAEYREDQRLKNEKKMGDSLARIRENFISATPAIFRATDTSHERFNTTGWARVKDWEPTQEKPWIGLIGETGTCKSRMAYTLAGLEIERMARRSAESGWAPNGPRQPTFKFVSSYEINAVAARLNAPDFKDKHAAREMLEHLSRVDFLMIDDIGKGRLSPQVASELFALIDHRYKNVMPMIWTANSTPEQIAAGMSEDMGAPFAGRLNDVSRILKFK